MGDFNLNLVRNFFLVEDSILFPEPDLVGNEKILQTTFHYLE